MQLKRECYTQQKQQITVGLGALLFTTCAISAGMPPSRIYQQSYPTHPSRSVIRKMHRFADTYGEINLKSNMCCETKIIYIVACYPIMDVYLYTQHTPTHAHTHIHTQTPHTEYNTRGSPFNLKRDVNGNPNLPTHNR